MKKGNKEGSQSNNQFAEALNLLNVKIVKLDLGKPRPVSTNIATFSVQKFSDKIREMLGSRVADFPEVFRSLYDVTETEDMLVQHAREIGAPIFNGKMNVEIPDDLKGLTLNLDMTAKGRDHKFFLTDDKEQVSRVSGDTYLLVHQLSLSEAAVQARRVFPEYLPRREEGVFSQNTSGRTETIFNSYVQPYWRRCEDWERLPNKLPSLVKKLVSHLFENEDDRTYFWDWAYASLFHRAPVFLTLCGEPGIGKNRLKLLLRALHGHDNTIDGKKSTITERFNGQLPNATLVWFDELQYDIKMENTMKELPNDTIAIERKGLDSTRGTKIYASFSISNNKPRDNYISFDSRKFAPLSLTKRRLEESMTKEEIDLLSKKIEDPTSSTYDVSFIAQTAKWLKNNGSSGRWPNLEYRGPMFWYLAHTSMSQYQKRLIVKLSDCIENRNEKIGWDQERKSFLWSKFHSSISGRGDFKDLKIPDHSTVQAFLESFRDKNGKKVYETNLIPDPNPLGDFWIKPLNPTKKDSKNKHPPFRPPGMSQYQWDKIKSKKTTTKKELKDVDIL